MHKQLILIRQGDSSLGRRHWTFKDQIVVGNFGMWIYTNAELEVMVELHYNDIVYRRCLVGEINTDTKELDITHDSLVPVYAWLNDAYRSEMNNNASFISDAIFIGNRYMNPIFTTDVNLFEAHAESMLFNMDEDMKVRPGAHTWALTQNR